MGKVGFLLLRLRYTVKNEMVVSGAFTFDQYSIG